MEKLGEITEREFRGYWDQTIADAGNTEATLQAMAAEITHYRRALALLAGAIELARVGAPFAVMPPKPLWKPKPSDSIDGIPTSE